MNGRFRAFDQATGKVLWETNLGSSVRDVAPGLVTRLARLRNGVGAPELSAGHRVMRRDDASVRAAFRLAAAA